MMRVPLLATTTLRSVQIAPTVEDPPGPAVGADLVAGPDLVAGLSPGPAVAAPADHDGAAAGPPGPGPGPGGLTMMQMRGLQNRTSSEISRCTWKGVDLERGWVRAESELSRPVSLVSPVMVLPPSNQKLNRESMQSLGCLALFLFKIN